MSTSDLTMVSPFSSSNTRSTPCVDGCCGPIFRTIVCSGPMAVWTVVMAQARSVQDGRSAWTLRWIIFTERVAFPVIRQEHAPQVGVPLKTYAKQVENLPFVPVGRRPDGHDGLDYRSVARQGNTQAQDIPAG